MYRLRRISTIEDFALFRSGYESVSNNRGSHFDLAGGRFFGIYRRGEMVGGASLQLGPSYRALELPPGPLSLFSQIQHGKLIEVNHLWLAPEHRGNRARFLIYLLLLAALVRHRSDALIAFTTRSNLWSTIYEPMGSKVIYHGPMTPHGNEVRQGWVFLLPFRKFLIGSLRYFYRKGIKSVCRVEKDHRVN